ncbi:Extradiol aromatic ring-opening dioxygenase [Patellaria atrata CBS 101060]|uniref:Extradiol aromatic ring-opening dioxygenase n=1 Tax=Patellaria atrata CBS 101060 TaxID=1346257 RepID=A0A9P4VX82_9PEZI|nr:Extradiol aromatic ring-opening dioxygenase [Patellaria atrata CBS 101060]
MPRAPVIALSHGGGPMPILGGFGQEEIVKSLKTRVPQVLKLGTPEEPRAIILITAHWSENQPTISGGTNPSLYYDYSGFPPEAYQFKYPAPGSPEIAQQIAQELKDVGFKPVMDKERGWDHGVFVPIMLINPRADVPIIQMSVLKSESPTDHFKMGQALSRLRDSNIAIVGSGFASFHNVRLLFSGIAEEPSFQPKHREWNRVVTDAVEATDPKQRLSKFDQWRNWPSSYDMHPRGGAEHFLPLVVCAGAGGEGKAKSYTDDSWGLKMYSYYWD